MSGKVRTKCFLERAADAHDDIRVIYVDSALDVRGMLGALEREYSCPSLRVTAHQHGQTATRVLVSGRESASLQAVWDAARSGGGGGGGGDDTLKLWLQRADSSGTRTPPLLLSPLEDPVPAGSEQDTGERRSSGSGHRVHQITPPLSPANSSGGEDDDDEQASLWRARSYADVPLSRDLSVSAENLMRARSYVEPSRVPAEFAPPQGMKISRPRARSNSEGDARAVHAVALHTPPHSPPLDHSPPDSPPLSGTLPSLAAVAAAAAAVWESDSSTTTASLVSPTSPTAAFQWGPRLIISPDVGQPVQKPRLQIRPEPRFDLIDSGELTMSGQHMAEIGFERSEKELGRGAVGKVWLGLRDNGEFLAIKEIQIAPNDKYTQRLEAVENEIELMRSLDHPHIVRYLGSKRDVERGAFYILLEYVSCGSIQALLKTMGRPLDERVIRKYARQILLGLAYLHSRSPPVAHRDIKAANVLVETTGNVKLADFGCSKVFSDLLEREYNSVLGTPRWMPPEVIRQEGAGLAADIWSFGCTVLEMATAQPPWAHIHDNHAVMFHIASSTETPPIPDSLSEEGKDFVRLCLQRDPSRRPTAAQLLTHVFVSSEHISSVSQRELQDSEEMLNSLVMSQSLTMMPQFLSVLPANLVVYIFQFLPVHDLCSVAAVCRHWRAAAAVDALWKVKAQQEWPWLESAKVQCAAAIAIIIKRSLQGNRWRDVYVQGHSNSWRKRNLMLDTLRGHSKAVLCIETGRASDSLVTGGEDKKIRVWSIAKRKCVQTLRGHTKAVTCVKFDDASRVLSGGADCVVRLWDAQRGKLLRSLEAHRGGAVGGVDFLGGSAVSCGADGVRAWDLETGACVASLLGGQACNAVKMDVSGARALVACQDGALRLLDLRGRFMAAAAAVPPSLSGSAGSVGGSGSGGGADSALLLAGHTDSVTGVQWGRAHDAAPFSTQDVVASCSADATVRLWDVRAVRAHSVLRPTGYDGPLYAVSMGESVLVAGGRDRVLHLWDVATEELLRQLKQHHSDAITGVAVGPYQRVFSCSRDKTVRVLRQDAEPAPAVKRPSSSTMRGGLLRLTEMFSPSASPHHARDDTE